VISKRLFFILIENSKIDSSIPVFDSDVTVEENITDIPPG
jgi:hypothetical protein